MKSPSFKRKENRRSSPSLKRKENRRKSPSFKRKENRRRSPSLKRKDNNSPSLKRKDNNSPSDKLCKIWTLLLSLLLHCQAGGSQPSQRDLSSSPKKGNFHPFLKGNKPFYLIHLHPDTGDLVNVNLNIFQSVFTLDSFSLNPPSFCWFYFLLCSCLHCCRYTVPLLKC